MQSPPLERKTSPVGVASVTVTLPASLGPLFVTVIVYAIVCPGMTDAGAAAVIARSAEPPVTVTDADWDSLPGAGSLVADVTDAVFTMGLAPA